MRTVSEQRIALDHWAWGLMSEGLTRSSGDKQPQYLFNSVPEVNPFVNLFLAARTPYIKYVKRIYGH